MKLECLQVTPTSFSGCFSFSASFSEGIHLLTGPDMAAADALLDLLTGRCPPSQGQILFLGYDIFLLGRAYQNHLAYFSRYPLFPDSFPLRHFLLYANLLQRLPPEPAQAKADRLLEQLHLAAFAACPLGQLSSQARRQVRLAVTLSSEAPVYLLRRPFSFADPECRPGILRRLEAVAKKKIVLLTEPDPSLLRGLDFRLCPVENQRPQG